MATAMATDVNENINKIEKEAGLSQLHNEKDTDWKRRTLELEEQLYLLRERVNSQTGKIREAVAKRVCIVIDILICQMSQITV